MSSIDISMLAIEVRKWDLEAQKIHLTSFYVMKNEESSIPFEVSILQPPEMVEEFLGKLRFELGQFYQKEDNDSEEEIEIGFDNETFFRQKTYNYFKRITSELNATRKKKGQPKMIFTTHMDIYNENQDVSFLPKKLQFFVVLNWVRKYYDRDYKKAVEPLRKLIKVDPGYGPAYKWLARSLKKIRKYDEAMKFYEKYAEVDNSLDAWLDLAKSYRKGKLFDESKEIYDKILKDDPKNQEARIGIAQIQYATWKKSYIKILDMLHKEDSEWLKEWLTEEFNFRIYVNEKTPLTPVQAAKFLGFAQIPDLTQRAFKNEIPSHFNPSRARLSFYKEELENWASVMNKFKCLEEEIVLYPDKINQPDETDAEAGDNESGSANSGNKPKTKVEEILMQIRNRKAQREAEQKALTEGLNHKKNPSKKKTTKKSPNQLSLLKEEKNAQDLQARKKPAAKRTAKPAAQKNASHAKKRVSQKKPKEVVEEK